MAIIQYNWPLMKALVSLRRIARALDRLAPPAHPSPRHVELSIASREDFERGFDERNRLGN